MKPTARISALLLLAVFTILVSAPAPEASRGSAAARSPDDADSDAAELSGVTDSLPSPGSEVREAYGKLPLAFVPNAGQIDERVRFSATVAGATFYFTPEQAVFSFRNVGAGRGDVVLAMAFLGANPNTTLEGQRLGPGKVNYLVGRQSEWRVGLPTYTQLVYRDLWPGIDMVFRGDGSRLKYEFVVRPGAEVDDVRLAYRGAERLSIDRGGQLRIHTSLGVLEDTRPVSYQQVGGTQVPVESRYVIDPAAPDAAAYGFAVGAYDRERPLVIDPGLVYSTFLGGGGSDIGNPIVVDAIGQAYVVGETTSTNFPTTPGAFDTSSNGSDDVFVTKLNATGTTLVYSTYLGGSSTDRGFGIAIDTAGTAYVTGVTNSTNFPTTPGAFDTTFNGNGDAFVTRLNATGTALVYSTYLGGTSSDEASGIVIDAAGNAHLTGVTNSSNFPITLAAFDTSYNGGDDAFVTKLNPVGSAPLVYSTFLGGGSRDRGFGIAVDGAGNAYVTGETNSITFPTTVGAFDMTPNGGFDAFVTKLNVAGPGPLLYSTYLGGTGDDEGSGIVVDSAGSAYVTGQTSSTNFPTTAAAFDTSPNGNDDVFVTKLNPAGSAPLSYSTYLGGNSADRGFSIAIDSAGNAYVTGETASSSFPTTAGAVDTTHNGSDDVFVTRLNAAGSAPLLYSTFLGGSSADRGFGIAVDTAGNAYVTGETESGSSTNPFPTTPGAFDTSFNGNDDAFVTKLDMIPAGGTCITNAQCNDGNTCTNDSCVAFSCVNTPNTNSCDDGNACTQTDTCAGGMCVGTNPVVCTAEDQCHVAGTCDPSTGVCSNPTAADGTSCNDGSACTTGDTCSAGSCVGGAPLSCDDGNVCTDESCDPTLGCVPAFNTAPCDDGNACTGEDTCSAGMCVGGAPPNCDDGNICTDDSCDPASGCVNDDNTAPCDDDNACTTSDACAGGSCGGGPPLDCSDGLFCTGAETCDPELGCQPGTPPDCDDGDVCTADACNETEDSCEHVAGELCAAGKVTGGGKVITYLNMEANFGFVAQRKVAGTTPAATGHFNYNEPGLHVNGPVDTLIFTGPRSAIFSGTCGIGCTFVVEIEDRSEPNRPPDRDKLRVTVNGIPRNPLTPDVIKGNIQFHDKPPP